MTYEFTRVRRVQFAETDMAGIMHFANFFRVMEETEHAFFRSLGLLMHGDVDGVMHGWARVRASCDYVRPARYADRLQVQLLVMEVGGKSIRHQFRFHLLDDAGEVEGPEIARGEMTVVHVTKTGNDAQLRSGPVPDDVRRQVTAAPSQLLES